MSEWSWSLGEVLDEKRKADNTTVLKKGKKEDAEIYRLISLTSVPETISRHIKDKKGVVVGMDLPRGNYAWPTR